MACAGPQRLVVKLSTRVDIFNTGSRESPTKPSPSARFCGEWLGLRMAHDVHPSRAKFDESEKIPSFNGGITMATKTKKLKSAKKLENTKPLTIVR